MENNRKAASPSSRSNRLDQLVAKLQAARYRLTPQRLALVRMLVTDTSHPSADQIYARLRTEYPTISLATVYNTLEVLVDIGEALPLDLNEGWTRYDVHRPAAHPHLVCRKCGRVDDLEIEGLSDFVKTARASTTFSDLQPRIFFDGICPDCNRALGSASATGIP
ncbi:MAG TPA: Fur family transcriptional regulator [Chloroflexota bacterium]|nr:Fur family transcriptional regulator [Chloroflexota bacterium]